MIRIALTLCFFCQPTLAETLVATKVVRPNALITETDFEVAETGFAGALDASAMIVGLEARITLYPGRPIMPEHVGPAAIIERNQPITLIFRRGTLTISTDARALARGGIGDVIRVMNLASRTTVSGRILANGNVEVSSQGF